MVMASAWFCKLFGKKSRSRRPARLRLENLETRLTPAISWTNKGNDGFGAFGGKADMARNVVQAAIDDWNRVIVDNQLNDGTYNLKVEMDDLEEGTNGLNSDVLTIGNRPYRGRVRFNTDKVNEYFVDPTPNDHGEFQGGVLSPFAALASAPEAVGRPDLYTVAVHEIGHAVGLTLSFNSGMRRLVKDGSFNGVKLTNTGIKDPQGAGNLFLAKGPSGTVILTGTDRGEVSDPEHIAHAQDVNFQGTTYYGTPDFLNWTTNGGSQRRLISDQVAMLFKDLYGYTVKAPSSMESFFAVFDSSNGELTVRGAGDRFIQGGTTQDVVSHDKIVVSSNGPTTTVTVTVDTNFPGDMFPGVPGSGAGKRTFTNSFPTANIKSLRLLSDDGNDDITVSGAFPKVEKFLMQGGAGHDKFSLNVNMPNAVDVVIEGNGGKDTITVKGTFVKTFTNPAVHGNDGNDIINLLGAAGTGFTVTGGQGNDLIDGSNGPDFLQGGTDQDTIRGHGGEDGILGGDGNDTLDGGNGNDTVVGENGSDTLRGGGNDDLVVGGFTIVAGDFSADTLDGDAGNDTLIGDNGNGPGNLLAGGGNDTLNGGSGNDLLFGQAGNDKLTGQGGGDGIFGGDGNDRIVGGQLSHLVGDSSGDSLFGEAGDDTIYGDSVTLSPFNVPEGNVGGADILNGGSGNDKLYGQAGNDLLIGEDGNDTLVGGDGNDRMIGDFVRQPDDGGPLANGNDVLRGGKGNDTLLGDNGAVLLEVFLVEFFGGADYLDGGDGNDKLYGQKGNDKLLGGKGGDQLFGGWDDDQLIGGTVMTAGVGADFSGDYLDGGNDNDILVGDNLTAQNQVSTHALAGGKDILLGGRGTDTLHGQAGDDQLVGGIGNDNLKGGAGNDILVGGVVLVRAGDERDAAGDILDGGVGNDRLFGDDVFNPLVPDEGSTGGPDTLLGGAGDDQLFGQGGMDRLVGGYGDDKLFGGLGDDVLVGGLVAPGIGVPDFGKDRLEGGDGDDVLMGDNVTAAYQPIESAFSGGADKLFGQAGNDKLFGQAGNDELRGGPGLDELFGGSGNDLEEQDDAIVTL
jgi:Ca2+-binding RTX toxin-like protein